MCLKDRWVQIHSFKHNGQLHRYWEKNYVLDENDKFFIVASNRTRVVEADGRCWFTHEPAITIFSKNDWYNVIAMLKEDGVCYYCNIASPSIEDDGKIKYIDYDLDLKLYPDGNIKVLDEKEYEKHKSKYKYDQRLDLVLRKEVEKIYHLMETRSYPFDDKEIYRLYEVFEELLKKKQYHR